MKKNYRLLDTGSGRRLEMFGDLIVSRRAKQASWNPACSSEVWSRADLIFENGCWNRDVSDIRFNAFFDEITFELKPMGGGQLGVFPEQESNWSWLKSIVSASKSELRILNGFASTGGSTLFSSTRNTTVCHVDGSNTALGNARRNALLSKKNHNRIRWITDDVLGFMKREVRRGKTYDGFIFDPPAFGRGKKGSEWKLKRDLSCLLDAIGQLAAGSPEFVLISSHDPGLSAGVLAGFLSAIPGINEEELESGVLEIKAESGQNLQGGFYSRWKKR